MSVNTLVTLTDSIRSKWSSNVVLNRSGEQGQLQAHLGGEVNYALITKQLDEWSATLGKLSKKPRVSRTLPKTLLQAASQCLSGLSHALDHAGNGVDWICNNKSFAINYSLAILLIRELTSETAKEASAIVDAADRRLENDLATLQTGSEVAQSLINQSSDINVHIKTIEQASGVVTAKIDDFNAKIVKINEEIETVLSSTTEKADKNQSMLTDAIAEFSTTLASAKDTVAEALRVKEDAQSLIEAALKAEAEAAFKYAKAIEALDLAREKQIATNNRLTEALQNAQMEGLAGSFTRMAIKTEGEIEKEQKKFESALFYLVIIGLAGLIMEWSLGFPKSSEEFGFRLIRTLSLAAPGIWIAWVATKKLGALNRVFSDYQYKSASALAYESYRQTVANAGDDELKKQLLAFAIRAFGENPTGYFDTAQNDASSPGESWLSKLLPSGKQNTEK